MQSMKSQLGRVAMVLMVLASLLPARADETATDKTTVDSPVRATLERHYASLATSLKAADEDAILAMTTEDFTSTNEDGATRDRDAYRDDLENVNKTLLQLQVSEVVNTIQEFRDTPNHATVNLMQQWKAGIPGPDGKTHALVMTALYRDIWVPNEDKTGWLLRHSNLLDMPTATMDGAPLDLALGDNAP